MINLGTLSKFYRRNCVWIFLFYKESDPEKSTYADIWKKLASEYYGIFKTAAIDCEESEELCEEFEVEHTPSVLSFPSKLNGDPNKFTGDFEIKKLASSAIKLIESFVQIVNKENY